MQREVDTQMVVLRSQSHNTNFSKNLAVALSVFLTGEKDFIHINKHISHQNVCLITQPDFKKKMF